MADIIHDEYAMKFERGSVFFDRMARKATIRFCIVGSASSDSSSSDSSSSGMMENPSILSDGYSFIYGYSGGVAIRKMSDGEAVQFNEGEMASIAIRQVYENSVQTPFYEVEFSLSQGVDVPSSIRVDAYKVVGQGEDNEIVQGTVALHTDCMPVEGAWLKPSDVSIMSERNSSNAEVGGVFASGDGIDGYLAFATNEPSNSTASSIWSREIFSVATAEPFEFRCEASVFNHMRNGYVIDASRVQNGWQFRLFDGDFHGTDVIGGWRIAELVGNGYDGIDRIAESDEDGSWTVFNADGTEYGRIVDFFNFGLDETATCRFTSDYATEFKPMLLRNPSSSTMRRGILLSTAIVDSIGDTVLFKQDNIDDLLEFRILDSDGEPISDVANLSCVEFQVVENTPFESIAGIESSTVSDIIASSGRTLVMPFNSSAQGNMFEALNIDSPFINGSYRFSIVPVRIRNASSSDSSESSYESGIGFAGSELSFGCPVNVSRKVSYFPRPLTVSFLKEVTYTNSIHGRLAQIPFELYYYPSDEASAGTKVEEPVMIDTITGAYTSRALYEEMSQGGGSNPAYPCYWTVEPLVLKNDTSSQQGGSIWNDVCVEYDGETKSYVLHAPFGKSKIPAGKYVEIDASVKDANGASLGGNYEIETDGGDSSPSTYRMTNENNKTYYLTTAVLSFEGSGSYDGNGETTYSIRIKNVGSSNNSNIVWVICSGSSTISTDGSNVKLIANNVMTKTWSDSGYKWAESHLDPTVSFKKGYVRSLSSISHSDWAEPGEQGSEFSFSNVVGDGSFTMKDGSDQHGMSNDLWFMFRDVFGNTTNPATTIVTIHQEKPTALSLTITGSSGSTDYTGFYQRNGRFFPSEYVTVNFSAISEIGMSYDLTGHIKSSVHGDHLESGVAYRHLLKLNAKDIKNPLLYGNITDVEATVRLTVTDEAGNANQVESSIECIYRLHRAPYLNLREANATYSHGVYYSGSNEPMSEKQTSKTKFTRSWNEIWYPESHGAPLNADGSINEAEALRISKSTVDTQGANGPTDSELIRYDRLSLNAGENSFSRDTDGRILQNTDKWSLTKKYPAKENSRLVDDKYQTYWIIDNSGNPDFQLEFEVFDFSSHITKYPENLCARYTGDSVSVFDASDPGCVYDNPVVDENGRRHWKLKDSTKLSHLFSLKGSCFNKTVNPFTLLDSEVDGELLDTGSGFTCPSITNCSRICIVPFTDYGTSDESRGSGFKLKAGPTHYEEYVNYEYINSTGEFWIHMSPQNANASWSSKSGIKVKCDHYASSAILDYEECTATFSSRPLYPLLGTFSHYLHLYSPSDRTVSMYPSTYPYKYFSDPSADQNHLHCIKTFAASQDDFVDYANEAFYVSYTGSDPVKVGIYDPTVSGNDSSGKLTSYMMNNDTGILTCTGATPPLGRLFADYYHHTFYRLTSDGYGDLYFNGTGILVPASSTSAYTDWAYVDLKIVNEGGNTLNSGLLTFLSRGYVTKGTVVDTVLDMNRPWDVQEGTVAETVNRTGAVKALEYASLDSSYPATRQTAFNARASQTCSLGDIEPKHGVYVRVFWCIAQNAEGTAWIDCSKGVKTYSAELAGTYFIFSN